MTVEQLIQLYAPLVGLLGVVFWLGVLSNRVRTLEREEHERKEREAGADHDKIEQGRMLERLDQQARTLEKMERELSGIQRALANIAAGRVGQAVQIGGE